MLRQAASRAVSSLSRPTRSLSPKFQPRSAAMSSAALDATDSAVSSTKTVGTHSGIFHADEAAACYMLVNHTKEYKNAKIVRSRDMSVLNELDILVDVGAEFDPSRQRFDHHQREFNETFDSEHSIKLSSAGLVYRFFGREVIESILLQNPRWDSSKPLSKRDLDTLYLRLYDELFEGMDGVDNGVNRFDFSGEPRYKDNTNLSCRVSRLNPLWTEQSEFTEEMVLDRFKMAMNVTGKEIEDTLENLAFSWLPAREIVREGMENRMSVHDSGLIVELPFYCPWKSHLLELEKEMGLSGKLLYVILKNKEGDHRCCAVPLAVDSFVNRQPIKKEWCGLRDEKLEQESGIPGAFFVHSTGFIGGCKTREGSLRMAVKSLTPTLSDSQVYS